jgi:hypothetical protein
MDTRVLVVVALLAVAPVAPAAVGVDGAVDTARAAEARLTVTDVAVSPATPVTGEPVTLSVTVSNGAGSPSPVELDRVAVRAGGERLVAARELGTLSAGGSLTVPLVTNFSTPGEKRLTVVAVGTDEDGNRTTVRRPATVVVERAPPQIDVANASLVADTPGTVAVELSNPTTAPIRNVLVTADGPDLTAVEAREPIPALSAGATETVSLRVRPDGAGDRRLRVAVRYTTAAGVVADTARNLTVRAGPARADVGVRVGPPPPPDDDGGDLSGLGSVGGVSDVLRDSTEGRSEAADRPGVIEVTVTNFGSVPVGNATLSPTVDGQRLPRQLVGSLAPGESRSVVVDLRRAPAGTVDLAVRYQSVAGPGRARTTYENRPGSGSVRLTGVDLAYDEDGRLRVSGNAGNPGERAVGGVVVSVGRAEGVDPAYPRRTYFVGRVAGNEFAPFELTAEVDHPNVSEVPVVVNYTVDGESVSRRVSVPYDDVSPPAPERGGPLSRLPGPAWLAVTLGVAVVGLAAALAYRRL